MSFRSVRLALLPALLIAATSLGQQDLSDVKIKTTHVAGAVYMLEGRGGNIGVSAGDDGVLMVDDQFAPLAPKIKAAIDSLGKGQPTFVLNTHWHGDHTGGNAEFGRHAPIIAQTNVRLRLSTPQELLGRHVDPSPAEALPVITFDDSLSVYFNGEEIKAMHYPHCHTDGDSVIFFSGSNVVHMGDLFFSGSFPFVDLSSGGDVEGLIKSVGTIIENLPADVKLIPGHGPLSTLDDLKHYRDMLVETTDIVRTRNAAGKTLTEIQSMGLPEKWADWGAGFISTKQWIAIVYASLNQ